jgi:hypothetical protein
MISAEQACDQLKELLSKLRMDMHAPQVDEIVKLYHEFSKIEIECARDDFFFQCGVFDFTGERLFYWDIVRQFMINEYNDYSHMEQLHYELRFDPNIVLEEFQVIEWRIAYIDTYFERLGELDEFRIPLEKYVPRSIHIYQEKV